MHEKVISGIQQIGIGVSNMRAAWNWYRDVFGMDIKIFEEAAMAELMLPYTGGKPRMRHAALAMNLMGGGGFEIWQYTKRVPRPPVQELQIGDLGIFAAKIKSRDVRATFEYFKRKNLNVNGLMKGPNGIEHFFITDPYGNIFQVVDSNVWFKLERKKVTGAVAGALIGVSDIDKSLQVYSDILGYDHIVYDKEDHFDDLKQLNSGHQKYRRVLLKHSKARLGNFSRLFGPSEIELVQAVDRKADKIFKNRYWGDLGYIHICFDITGMDLLRKECFEKGFQFTIDSDVHHESENFDMGEAAGHFAYIEDPDGTLIEFVETHKIPIIKKLGWYINLQKRKPEKPLPNWILKALKYSRIKEKHLK